MIRAVVIALFIVVFLFLGFACESKKTEEIELPISSFPDQQLDSSTIIFTVKGEKEAVLWAETLNKYLKQKLTKAYNLNVQFEGNPPEGKGVLVADSGYVSDKSDLIQIFGNVELETERGTKLCTTDLYWNTKSNTIYSDAHVRITRGSDWLEGDGFRTDIGFKNFTILKNIKGNLSL